MCPEALGNKKNQPIAGGRKGNGTPKNPDDEKNNESPTDSDSLKKRQLTLVQLSLSSYKAIRDHPPTPPASISPQSALPSSY